MEKWAGRYEHPDMRDFRKTCGQTWEKLVTRLAPSASTSWRQKVWEKTKIRYVKKNSTARARQPAHGSDTGATKHSRLDGAELKGSRTR